MKRSSDWSWILVLEFVVSLILELIAFIPFL
jgi:hypothetical protein